MIKRSKSLVPYEALCASASGRALNWSSIELAKGLLLKPLLHVLVVTSMMAMLAEYD